MGYQLNTDFSTIAPDEGVGRSYFPISDSKGWLCQIVASEGKETNAKDGTRLELTLQGLEGPVQGRNHDFSINVANPKQKAVEIGFGQMSAIAHVTGHIRVGNSAEWHNKPFRVVIVSDATEQYPQATKVSKILDVNGNSAKEAGKGVMSANAGNFNAGNQVHGQQVSQAGGAGATGNWGGTQQMQDQPQGAANGGQFAQQGQTGGNAGQFQATGNGAQFNPSQQQGGNFQQHQQQPQGQFQQNNGGNGPGWNQ